MDTTKTDLDLWSGISRTDPPEESDTRPEFKTTRNGYDQAQVNDYLGVLTGRLEGVEAEVHRLRSEVDWAGQRLNVALRERDAVKQERDAALQERPAAGEDTSEQVSSLVIELMVTLNRELERLRGEAQGEAEHILARARSKATRIRREAEAVRAAADLAAAQAREEAEQSVADLMAQRDSVVANLRLSVARSLETIGSLASSIGDENEVARRDGAEKATTSLRQDDQAAPLMELSFDQSLETIANLATLIGDENEDGRGELGN